MRKVAVTGGIASGKSLVCRLLKELGAYVLDADEIVHKLLSPDTYLSKKIIELLGSDIVDGKKLNRKKIAEKVFGNEEKLKELEKLIHPLVYRETEDQYNRIKNQEKYSLFVVEIPLLFETEGEKFYDYTVTVFADEELCKKRVKERLKEQGYKEGSYREEEYNRRMARQLSPTKKSQKANFTITNNGTKDELKEKVKELYFGLLKK